MSFVFRHADFSDRGMALNWLDQRLQDLDVALSSPGGANSASCGCVSCVNKLSYDGGETGLLGNPGPQEVSEPSDVIPSNTSTIYSVPIGGSNTGVINTLGDTDWFSVSLVAGQTYAFTLTGDSLADPLLELYGPGGVFITSNDDIDYPVNVNSQIIYTASQTGTYYLSADAYANSYTGSYTLAAEVAAPPNLLDSISWNYQQPTLNIDVYFATAGQSFNGETATRSWTAYEIAQAMAALATFSTFTPLTFTQVGTSTGAEMVLSLTDLQGALGYFQVGTPYGFFDPAGAGWSDGLAQGGYGFITLIHEFGHGLGLAHPHDTGGGSTIISGVSGPFISYGYFSLNQGIFTMMS